MKIALRPTRLEDLPFVTALERDAANRDFIGQWSDDEHAAAVRGENRREHRIVEVGDAPVGYVITYDGRGTSPSMYVKRILIADKERGIGTAAMAAVAEDAFTRGGIDFVWLLVREWNARAQAVYRKLGFARYEPVGDGADALVRYAEAPGPQSFRMRLDHGEWMARSPTP